MVAGLLFTYGLIAVVLVVNALRSPKPPTHRLPPLWLPAMIASEAAGLWLVVVAAVTALGLAAHAWNQQLGRLGIVLLILAFSGQVAVWLRSHLGARRVGPGARHGGPLWRRLLNRPPRPADDLEFETRELAPHPHRREPLQMDLYRRVGIGRPLGLIIYVHGGGWRGGHPRQAGQLLLQHLARSGWEVAAIEYPLSPAATFPEHLAGIDAALAWAESIERGPIVLMGGSSGAHLAAVAALTRANVHGLVGLYGIYDFLNRNRTRVDWPLIPRLVMKTTPEEDPEAYRRASPVDLVHGSAPPTLLVTGSFDSLVPPEESRHFARALRAHGVDTTYLEVPWAQHGFDTLAGPRTRAVAAAIETWLGSHVLAAPTGPRVDEDPPPSSRFGYRSGHESRARNREGGLPGRSGNG
ncbi:MAG: alpha/beta hydrolase [Acidimicrobiia bacterium]